MHRRALAVAFAVTAFASGLSVPVSAATQIDTTQRSASAQNDLLSLVNMYRAANGLQGVAPNGALTAAASWMAGDMAARNYIGHVSSDGRSPTQRMASFGYPATSMYTGEDLGAGYATADGILSGWQASAAHNAVLLNPNYNSIGIGLVYEPSSAYKWYWAADFGGPGGTVKVVVPPPAPQQAAAAKASTPQIAQPVMERATTAARGSSPQEAERLVDPEAAAESARVALIEERAARRLAHLFAVLLRIGGI
jgi:uncharacterized protein YkwD